MYRFICLEYKSLHNYNSRFILSQHCCCRASAPLPSSALVPTASSPEVRCASVVVTQNYNRVPTCVAWTACCELGYLQRSTAILCVPQCMRSRFLICPSWPVNQFLISPSCGPFCLAYPKALGQGTVWVAVNSCCMQLRVLEREDSRMDSHFDLSKWGDILRDAVIEEADSTAASEPLNLPSRQQVNTNPYQSLDWLRLYSPNTLNTLVNQSVATSLISKCSLPISTFGCLPCQINEGFKQRRTGHGLDLACVRNSPSQKGHEKQNGVCQRLPRVSALQDHVI